MNHNTQRTTGKPASGQGGFGLVELMIAALLMGILLLGLVELFVSNSKNANATATLSNLQDTGRAAVQLLTSDIRRAGYIGGNARVTDIAGTLGEAPVATTCPTGNSNWSRMVDQAIYGINDARTGYSCLPDAEYLRGDVLTVRFSESVPTPAGSMEANRPYLRSSLFDGRIFLGKDAANVLNSIPDISADNYALVAHTYYIGPSGRNCQGVAIPALFRKTVSATGAPASEELLSGVEHMQFRYQVGDQYLDADDVTDWNTVGAIELAVLVRAECPEPGFVNNRTFDIGDLGTPYGPTDSYRRQLFTSLTSIRN